LSGKVESVSGSCPAVTITLSGQTVSATSETMFKKVKCKDVKVGTDVRLTGWRMSDGTVRIDKVELLEP